MHPTKAFRTQTTDQNYAFARARAFGTLCVNAKDGPLISHVPFVLNEDGSELEAHLIRVNPIMELLEEPIDAVIAVTGPDGYISPDWYDVDNQVPTWNYIAVHLRGKLRRLEQAILPGILDKLSADFESRLAPKPPWTTGKMEPKIYERMQRAIVPIAMTIDDIQGTWKLSQNKPEPARLGAADGVAQTGVGSETEALAELMRTVGAE